MLKIKDNVDLKELEKYGFRFIDSTGRYEYYNRAYTIIYIKSWNREISIEYLTNAIDSYEHKLEPVIYDLIKDGLVVKVDNE